MGIALMRARQDPELLALIGHNIPIYSDFPQEFQRAG